MRRLRVMRDVESPAFQHTNLQRHKIINGWGRSPEISYVQTDITSKIESIETKLNNSSNVLNESLHNKTYRSKHHSSNESIAVSDNSRECSSQDSNLSERFSGQSQRETHKTYLELAYYAKVVIY